jgi:hypothetical protein
VKTALSFVGVPAVVSTAIRPALINANSVENAALRVSLDALMSMIERCVESTIAANAS